MKTTRFDQQMVAMTIDKCKVCYKFEISIRLPWLIFTAFIFNKSLYWIDSLLILHPAVGKQF